MSAFTASPGVRVYVRSLDRTGPVFRTFAQIDRVHYRNDVLDVSDFSNIASPQSIPGRSWLEMELTSDGRYLPSHAEGDVPLIDRLALAVLHGEDDAAFPLIDEFLISRGR